MSDDPIFSAGRVAVITGAAGGIGLAAAKHCAGAGMTVVMTDVSDGLEAAAAEVAAIGGTVEHRALDVSDLAAVRAMADDVFARHGAVALLMNNAGASIPTRPFDDYDAWRRTLEINFWGVANGVQAFTQLMLDQGSPGRIVNTGSKQGITNPPGNLAYNVSKSAVKTLTEGLQHALRNIEGAQVTAHLLIPGFTYTGMTRRFAAEKPAGAWTSEQLVERMVAALAAGDFYILCPDNETTPEIDARRILWNAGDLVENRPALSRWDPAYAAAFADWMKG
jgi:NAD(P)-dependent dehydrogenase (short-subunit alcohol dehydrogenase family)